MYADWQIRRGVLFSILQSESEISKPPCRNRSETNQSTICEISHFFGIFELENQRVSPISGSCLSPGVQYSEYLSEFVSSAKCQPSDPPYSQDMVISCGTILDIHGYIPSLANIQAKYPLRSYRSQCLMSFCAPFTLQECGLKWMGPEKFRVLTPIICQSFHRLARPLRNDRTWR